MFQISDRHCASDTLEADVLEGPHVWEWRSSIHSVLNWKWPSPRRFVPSGRKSVSGWLTTSLVGFKCVWGATAVIWIMCCNKCILWADLRSSVFELGTSNLHYYFFPFFIVVISASMKCNLFGSSLSELNYYHVNGFHLFWDILYFVAGHNNIVITGNV